MHVYFKHPDCELRTKIRAVPDLDLKADGGYVVAPPSTGPKGMYEWIVSPEDAEIADAPAWLVELAHEEKFTKASPVGDEIGAGGRNHTLFSLAGSMRERGMGEAEIEHSLSFTNQQRCKPPLDEEEVKKIAKSVARYEPGKVHVLKLSANRANSPNHTNTPNSPNSPNSTVKSAAKLLETEFAPTPWAVPGVLPEGVTLLVGKPKKGKSWMALGFCEAIAAGGVALGTKRVEKGEALYLALEDNERRMQKRLKKVLNGRACPPGMHYATEWPKLEEGGTEALVEWLENTPNARLVVIDTLQKVRTPVRGQNVYAEDYAALETLMPIAAHYGVAIVVVHHLRKGEAADPQDMISGSTGLSGGVDGYLILHKSPGSRGPTLYVEGRDIEEPEEYALHWNLNTATWTIEGTAEEVHISEERGAILVELNRSPEPMSPKELADVLPGKSHGAVRYLLHQMYHDDQVTRVSGKYEPANRTPNSKNPHGNAVKDPTVRGVRDVRDDSGEHSLTCLCEECTT
jgi:hypothetical protein